MRLPPWASQLVATDPQQDHLPSWAGKVLSGGYPSIGGQTLMPGRIGLPGNINLANRPRVVNPDGRVSSVLSTSFGEDGMEVLVPQVYDGAIHDEPGQAQQHYRDTGQHLGKFTSPALANLYAYLLHLAQANRTGGP